MIKLIVSDLDGTLLNEKHRISDVSLTAIQAAREAGIDFMIATGRHQENVASLLKDTPLTPAMICINGAQCFDAQGHLLWEVPLTRAKTMELLHIAEAFGLHTQIMCDRGIYSCDELEIHRRDFIGQKKMNDHDIAMLNDYYALFQKINQSTDLPNDVSIYKVELNGAESAKAKVAKLLEKDESLAVSYAPGSGIEINDIHASKGEALRRFCDSMHLYPQEVMVIGDSGNDLSMFAYFPYSFAMANAPQEVRSKASLIANRNSDDGVARAIFKTIARNQNYWTFQK